MKGMKREDVSRFKVMFTRCGTWLLRSEYVRLFALCGGFMLCTEASALMEPLATTTLVDRAECIVEGRVTNVTSRWSDDRSVIITEVVLDATDVLLGDTNRVSFLYLGGIVGDLEQQVSDMPTVTNGQSVLVFLCPETSQETKIKQATGTHGRRFALLGAAQGLYNIKGALATKDGFTVMGKSDAVERTADVISLKNRVRQRIRVSHPERSIP